MFGLVRCLLRVWCVTLEHDEGMGQVSLRIPTAPQCRVGFRTNLDFQAGHKDVSCVEHPDRVNVAWEALRDAGLLEQGVPDEGGWPEVDVSAVHTAEHVDHIRRGTLPNASTRSVFVTPDTFHAALTAAQCVMGLVNDAMAQRIDSGLAIVRPPGHHAERARAQGFCLFNNVALAAQALLTRHRLRRVAIVDWDVHAGNGQQSIFWTSDQVLTVSLHRYDYGTFYPGSPEGDAARIGEGRGKGFNVNVAWNTVRDGTRLYQPGDAEYRQAFQRVVLPMLRRFNPEFILVACGFDAAQNDPLGQLNVTARGFQFMTHSLLEFGVPVVLSLEGGYDLDNLRRCVPACAEVLLHPQTFARVFDAPTGPVHLLAQADIERTCRALQLP